MLRNLLTLVVVLSVALGATAKDDKNKNDVDLVEWANEQASKLPDEIDGVKIYRVNGFDNDGKARVTGFIDIPGLDKKQAFQAALLSVIDNLDTEVDEIEVIDFDAGKFVVSKLIEDGAGKDAATYAFRTAFSFDDGLMSFVTYDMIIGFKEKGLVPRKLAIEKINPAAKERHKELAEGLALESSRIIDDIVKNSAKNTSLPITHWDDIEAGKVTKGMNEVEVKFVGGQPRNITKSGSRVQWMFSNDFIVIFTDGVVSNVMQ